MNGQTLLRATPAPAHWDRLAFARMSTAPGPQSPEAMTLLLRRVAESRDRAAYAALFGHFAPRVKAYMRKLGATDAQAIQYIVARYGDFVLLKPPVEPATYALWFGPAAVLLLAGAGTLVYLIRRGPQRADAPAPLSETERQRLDELLGDGDPPPGVSGAARSEGTRTLCLPCS